MKAKLLKCLVFCLLAGCIALNPLPACAQEEADQEPQLLIKVPDIEKLLSDAQTVMQQDPQSKATQQLNMVRMMLFGTDWIDPGRSIVAGMVSNGAQSQWILLVPFHTANNNFQKAHNAIMGTDYYLISLPARPDFAVSPLVESDLINASMIPTAGDLVLEIPANRLISSMEAPLAASMKKIEEAQTAETAPAGLSPVIISNTLRELINLFKQVDVVRVGLGLDGDLFNLFMDWDAQPGTALAGVLIDPAGNNRLMDYPINLPVKFHSRAYNVPGMMDLIGSSFADLYRALGIDLNGLGEMSGMFTGETAGGLDITPNGLVMESIAVLQPGTDGEAFIRDTYLPWLEHNSKSVSMLASAQTGEQVGLYERTPDSVVAGTHVMGVKTNIALPASKDKPETRVFTYEMRIAAVNDLMLVASDDAGIERLINGTRNLVSKPAVGPIGRIDLDLGSYIKGIQSLMPDSGSPASGPENLGNMTILLGMHNGKLSTQTSFSVQEMGKLVTAIGAAVSKQSKTPTGGNNANATETQ
jgi:hypothetical protein